MFDINKCYDCFATEPNSAYFWSGLGENGQDIAAQVAYENGGTTLEMLMDKNKDELISAGFPYDEDLGGFYFSKDNAQDWQAISQAYAEQASGDVHAVLGDTVREGSVWNTKELPALEKNENVDKVISVDPSTGKEKDVLLDKNSATETTTSNFSNTINSQTVAAETGGGARAPNSELRGHTDNPDNSVKTNTPVQRGNTDNGPINASDNTHTAQVRGNNINEPTNNNANIPTDNDLSSKSALSATTGGSNKPNGFNM